MYCIVHTKRCVFKKTVRLGGGWYPYIVKYQLFRNLGNRVTMAWKRVETPRKKKKSMKKNKKKKGELEIYYSLLNLFS